MNIKFSEVIKVINGTKGQHFPIDEGLWVPRSHNGVLWVQKHNLVVMNGGASYSCIEHRQKAGAGAGDKKLNLTHPGVKS